MSRHVHVRILHAGPGHWRAIHTRTTHRRSIHSRTTHRATGSHRTMHASWSRRGSLLTSGGGEVSLTWRRTGTLRWRLIRSPGRWRSTIHARWRRASWIRSTWHELLGNCWGIRARLCWRGATDGGTILFGRFDDLIARLYGIGTELGPAIGHSKHENQNSLQ